MFSQHSQLQNSLEKKLKDFELRKLQSTVEKFQH